VSSTRDLRVTDLGTTKPTATTVAATRESSASQSAAADPPAETTNPVTDSTSSPSETESAQTEMPENGENSGRAISQPEFDELSKFKRDILYILYGLDDPKGLEIKEELEAYYEDLIHYGRLYPNLDALAEAGYVEKFDATGRSNGYRLTETGRSLLVARQKWEQARVNTTVSETIETDGSADDPVETSTSDATSTTGSDEDDETDDGEGDIVDDLMSDLEDL
jgi:DNA-binding PadR family transcriptional regulator